MLAGLAPQDSVDLELRIGQGEDMGRPSLLLTRAVKRDGKLVSAHVGGGCVEIMQGTFVLAGEA
jgi:trans-2,3-dihydro-3-hydroxyanthranilate isomerase